LYPQHCWNEIYIRTIKDVECRICFKKTKTYLCCGSGFGIRDGKKFGYGIWDRKKWDPGWKEVGSGMEKSRIREKHPDPQKCSEIKIS
jgi:hypothetical protein